MVLVIMGEDNRSKVTKDELGVYHVLFTMLGRDAGCVRTAEYLMEKPLSISGTLALVDNLQTAIMFGSLPHIVRLSHLASYRDDQMRRRVNSNAIRLG